MLTKRALGRSGILVSPIGLGTVKFGRATGVRYPKAFAIPADAAADMLLRRAHELGVNVLDTAPAYGVSEERLGKLLKGWRDSWVLCTKAGEEFDPKTGQSRFDFSPEAVTASVERSLKRLGTDRLDCVLLHSDGRDEWILRESGGYDALVRLRERGLIRCAGASTKTPEGALLAAERCDVVMVTLNPRAQADLPAVEAAQRTGAGVFVKKALDSGWVAPPDAPPEQAKRAVAEALGFALRQPGVSCVIVGTTNLARMEQNIAIAAEVCRAG